MQPFSFYKPGTKSEHASTLATQIPFRSSSLALKLSLPVYKARSSIRNVTFFIHTATKHVACYNDIVNA